MDCLMEQTHPDLVLGEDKKVGGSQCVSWDYCFYVLQFRYCDVLFTEHEVPACVLCWCEYFQGLFTFAAWCKHQINSSVTGFARLQGQVLPDEHI